MICGSLTRLESWRAEVEKVGEPIRMSGVDSSAPQARDEFELPSQNPALSMRMWRSFIADPSCQAGLMQRPSPGSFPMIPYEYSANFQK